MSAKSLANITWNTNTGDWIDPCNPGWPVPQTPTTSHYMWVYPDYSWQETRIKALEDEVEELKKQIELLSKETGKKVIKRSPYEVVDVDRGRTGRKSCRASIK